MTKDLFALELGGYEAAVPWAIFVLAASPVLMVAALVASDRGLQARARRLVLLMVAGLLLALVHDVVLVPQTAGSLTFLGAFFIVVLAPIFAWLWPWLERRGLNPSTPVKMGMGLVIAGLSFLPLVAAARIAGTGEMASVWWLVLAYLILELGEVCLSPIGLSAVTTLSVTRVVGVMMGAFWLGTAYSEVLAAQFGKLASLELPEDGVINMAEAAVKYADLFQLMVWVGVGAGAFALLISPLLRRGMHGVK